MKILVIGSGGREHALAWRLAQSARVAEIRGTEPGQGAKAMLCSLKGQAGPYALVILPGDQKLDMKKVGAALGGKKAELVKAETAMELTGCRIGAIPLGLHAHRRYLERHGTPTGLDQLSSHRLIGFDRQLAYIRELIGGYRHQVLMGDMNTHATDLLQHSPLRDLGLIAPQVEATFPSWRPQRCLDHILLSPSLTLERVEVLSQPISDHLPVAVEIRLPDSLTVDTLPVLR